MIKVLKAKDLNEIYNATHQTHRLRSLTDVDYYDLVRIFGQASIPVESADGKVQKEWVFDYKGEIFTIYDWKTYDEHETMTELFTWNIGGKSFDQEFADELLHLLPAGAKIV
jgi:hypothetical protein